MQEHVLHIVNHIVVYFHQFGQKNNVPIGARSNIIFIHNISGVVGTNDLLHEPISNIDKGYHVVESELSLSRMAPLISSTAECEVMIVCQLTDNFHAKTVSCTLLTCVLDMFIFYKMDVWRIHRTHTHFENSFPITGDIVAKLDPIWQPS